MWYCLGIGYGRVSIVFLTGFFGCFVYWINVEFFILVIVGSKIRLVYEVFCVLVVVLVGVYSLGMRSRVYSNILLLYCLCGFDGDLFRDIVVVSGYVSYTEEGWVVVGGFL